MPFGTICWYICLSGKGLWLRRQSKVTFWTGNKLFEGLLIYLQRSKSIVLFEWEKCFLASHFLSIHFLIIFSSPTTMIHFFFFSLLSVIRCYRQKITLDVSMLNKYIVDIRIWIFRTNGNKEDFCFWFGEKILVRIIHT